jgi:hypothetical protein
MKFKGSKKLCVKVAQFHKLCAKAKLKILYLQKHIKFDFTKYEEYNIIEVIEEFCSVVPSFFNSYDELYRLFMQNPPALLRKLEEQVVNFLTPPIGQYQAHTANIILQYFEALVEINKKFI